MLVNRRRDYLVNISQIRGALLEEAILYLLEKVGYETIEVDSPNTDNGLRVGHYGLEVRGHDSWHQIDTLSSNAKPCGS